MKKIFSTSRGFTLIELLTVVAIISILSSVVLVSMSNARSSASDKKRIADLAQVQLSLKLYQVQNGDYPSYDAGVSLSAVSGLDTYGTIPTDPKEDGGSYQYVYDSDYDCTAAGQIVLYANTMETGAANEDSLCGGTDGTKYVVVIQ